PTDPRKRTRRGASSEVNLAFQRDRGGCHSSPLVVRFSAFNIPEARFTSELAPRRVLLRGSVGGARTARTLSSTHAAAESPADSCGTEFAARSAARAPNPSDAERAGAWKL